MYLIIFLYFCLTFYSRSNNIQILVACSTLQIKTAKKRFNASEVTELQAFMIDLLGTGFSAAVRS